MELLIRNAAYRRKKTNETLYLSSGARWGTNHSKSNNGKGNGRVALKTTGRNQNSRAGRPGACPAPVLLSGHTSRAERTRGSPRLPPYGIVAEAEDNPINPNYVVRVCLPSIPSRAVKKQIPSPCNRVPDLVGKEQTRTCQ